MGRNGAVAALVGSRWNATTREGFSTCSTHTGWVPGSCSALTGAGLILPGRYAIAAAARELRAVSVLLGTCACCRPLRQVPMDQQAGFPSARALLRRRLESGWV